MKPLLPLKGCNWWVANYTLLRPIDVSVAETHSLHKLSWQSQPLDERNLMCTCTCFLLINRNKTCWRFILHNPNPIGTFYTNPKHSLCINTYFEIFKFNVLNWLWFCFNYCLSVRTFSTGATVHWLFYRLLQLGFLAKESRKIKSCKIEV